MKIEAVPQPKELYEILLILAKLEIILQEEEWLRYYSFEKAWSDQTALAVIDNGAGDDVQIIFAPEGVIVKGFDHESGLSPHAQEEYAVYPGIYNTVPEQLLTYLHSPQIEFEDVTFCIWRTIEDESWQKGMVDIPVDEDDGFEFLMGTIHTTATSYCEWAEGYYEMPIPSDVISTIYNGAVITADTIKQLNPERHVEDVLKELAIFE